MAGGGRVEGLLRGLVGSLKSGSFSGDVWRRGGRVLEEWNSRSSWRSVWPRSPWEVVSRWVLLLGWAERVPLRLRLRRHHSLDSPWLGDETARGNADVVKRLC